MNEKMARTRMIKIFLDIGLTILFLVLMKVAITGMLWHEILGVGVLVLLGVHLLLNWKWLFGIAKNLGSGRVSGRAGLLFGLVCGLFPLYLLMVGSGLLISQELLPNLFQVDLALWSTVHHLSAMMAFILTAVHIGLHWKQLMQIFGQMLGMMPGNRLRTGLARVMLVPIIFLGCKAIMNPDIQRNVTELFAGTASSGGTAKLQSSKEDREATTLTVVLTSDSGLLVDTPTLEDYLSGLVCSGCGKRCPLTNLQCGRGTSYKTKATAEYESLYGADSGASSDTLEPKTGESDSLPNGDGFGSLLPEEGDNFSEGDGFDSLLPDEGDSSLTPAPEIPSTEDEFGSRKRKFNFGKDTFPDTEEIPEEELPEVTAPTETTTAEASTEAGLADYFGLMGLVVAGTHYLVVFRDWQKKQPKQPAPQGIVVRRTM